MASVKKMETKDGRPFYKISVSRGYGVSPWTMRWYPPDNYSQRTIARELRKVTAEFERACAAGEVLNCAERKAKKAEEAAEAAKLKSVRAYADGVYMSAKEQALSENTRSSYRMFLDRHILPVIGGFPLAEVTPAMLSKLLLDFQKAGYSHASAVKLYNILNGLFDMAFMDDSITVNPMLKVKRPAQSKDDTPKDDSDKAYTVEEVRRILACLENEPLKWRAYIRLMFDTGARRGECCAARWEDIDFQAGTVTIRRNLQYTAAKGVFETSPKNGKTRVVDIGSETLSLLRRLRQEQVAEVISSYVFTQDGSAEPMFPQSPTRYFKKFGDKYGIADFHPHKLRHSSASIAITNGADVASVSARLGHSDTAITLRMYVHANEDSIRRAGQVVRDALKAENV